MIALLLALKLSLPITEGGPAFNVPPFAPFSEQTVANASAHVGWSLAVPLLAGELWGRRASAWTGIGWCAATTGWEATRHFKHGPEVRTDLLTNCLPSLGVALWQLLR